MNLYWPHIKRQWCISTQKKKWFFFFVTTDRVYKITKYIIHTHIVFSISIFFLVLSLICLHTIKLEIRMCREWILKQRNRMGKRRNKKRHSNCVQYTYKMRNVLNVILFLIVFIFTLTTVNNIYLWTFRDMAPKWNRSQIKSHFVGFCFYFLFFGLNHWVDFLQVLCINARCQHKCTYCYSMLNRFSTLFLMIGNGT